MNEQWAVAAEVIGRRVLARLGSTTARASGMPSRIGQSGSELTVDPAIWSGEAGTALFLAELFRWTSDQRFWDAADGAAERCLRGLSRIPEPLRTSFLSGGFGLVYLLCRMGEIAEDVTYIRRARRVASDLLASTSEFTTLDHLSGVSGALLCLLYLDGLDPEEELHPLLTRLSSVLLSRTRQYASGVYWDMAPEWPRPLCGFSHGVSGVANALVAMYSRHPSNLLRTVIQNAFQYEDQFFDDQDLNWPDHRPRRSSGTARRRRRSLNAWCHGAAGIGMVRLRAVQLGLHEQKVYLDRAVTRCEEDLAYASGAGGEWETLTYCHGLAGLADLLLLAATHFAIPPAVPSLAATVGDQARDQLATFGGLIAGHARPNEEDISLYVGSSGVGHFLLRLSDPIRTPSVLSPWPRQGTPGAWKPSDDLIESSLIRAMVPRALMLFPQLGRSLQQQELSSPTGRAPVESLLNLVVENCRRTVRESDEHERDHVSDLLSLEEECAQASAAVSDFVEFRNGWRTETTKSGTESLERVEFTLANNVRIFSTRWNWSSGALADLEQNLELPSGAVSLLIIPSYRGSLEYALDPYSAWMLGEATAPITLKKLLARRPVGLSAGELRRRFRSAVANQVLRRVGSESEHS